MAATTLVQLILNATAAGKSMLTAANAAAQKVLLSLGNVDNTSDANKPVSTAQQMALDLKAPLTSPTLTGTPAAPTAAPGTNTTQIATTAFVATAAASYMPLAGGTFVGDVKFTDATYDIGKSGATRPRDGFFSRDVVIGGTLTAKNGTSPTSLYIHNTYTSATSYGRLGIIANAGQTAYEIASEKGSAGGANLPINIGHRDSAGAFTRVIGITTANELECSDITSTTRLNLTNNSAWGLTIQANGADVRIQSNSSFGICSGGSNATPDVYLSRTAATWRIRADSGVAIRNLADSAAASLTCAAITATLPVIVGVYTFATVPAASSHTGACIRISDRAQRLAYSDATNWRFVADDIVIS